MVTDCFYFYKLMNIQHNNNITFTSKNFEIRQADKIMRNLMNEYPVCSTSRVKYYNVIQKDKSLISKTRSMYNKLKTIREKLFEFSESTEIFDQTLKSVRDSKNAKLDNPATYSKHAFIVDPWAGICDYVANVFNHYKGTFLVNQPPQDINCPKKFIFEEKDYLNTSSELCQTVAQNHPELVIK